MTRKSRTLSFFILFVLTSLAFSEDIQTKCQNEERNAWTIEPFRHGYSVVERKYGISTYDMMPFEVESSRFPIDRLTGTVRIPVFLADWSDFDPATDPSNKSNPRSRSKHPEYKRHSVEEIQTHLNSDTGPAGYYKAASGGQFMVQFDVFPWISSNTSKYLKDKEPAYYRYDERRKAWVASKKPYALDVLRAAIAEKDFDPRKYDADKNKVIDGSIIVYEGSAGPLAGKNISYLGPLLGSMGNFKGLLAEDDPNFETTKGMDILFHRSINVPEASVMGLRTMTHELGHLFLGYQDYYKRGDVGVYAMSARGSSFSPAAMEKWLFAKWISPRIVTAGTLTLDNHHLKIGEAYSDEKTYLHQVFIDSDPFHYFLIENRFFDPQKRHFDKSHSGGRIHPESGLVIFEVNERLSGRKKWGGSSIIRHYPEPKVSMSSDNHTLIKYRTFQTGEDFHWKGDTMEVHITNISPAGEVITYDLSTTSQKDTDPPTAPGDVSASSITDTTATISWSASEDDTAVAGYIIDIALDPDFREPHGDYAKKNVRLNTEHLVTRLEEDARYYLRLRAVDVAGNVSGPSAACAFQANAK